MDEWIDVLPMGRFIILRGLIGFYTIPFFNFSSRLGELCNYDAKAKRGGMLSFFLPRCTP
jgi:hypothetical protein